MKQYTTWLLALVFALGISDADAAAVADQDAPWSAQWIGPESSGSNTWLCFRQTVSLSAAPVSLRARLAVDSKYWLWINGKLVVFEGGLKRGPTPQDTYYDEVDIGPELRRGSNTIAVLVWYWGKSGFSHNSSGKAGLVFEANGPGVSIMSDASWKVRVHPSFNEVAAPGPNYRLSEFNIGFDARKDLVGWMQPRFDDVAWPTATPYGVPPVAPWNHLEKRPVPRWKDSGLKSYDTIVHAKVENGTQLLKAKLPYNAQVTPYFKVRAAAGQRIEIQTDNYQGGGSPNVRAVYVTREGVQEFESPGWMNGHEVQYRAPATVQFLKMKYRETGYNADFAGEFRCDDADLNVLWQKARRTLYVTMRDNYMDCPDRERAQWWGDTVNELGEAFYVFDATNGPLLARKGIRELARWQRADHTLYSPVPSGRPTDDAQRKDVRDGSWNVELPPQMLASVSKYGFWTYYLYTGDRDTIALVYPHVRDYLKIWQQDTNGLVVHRAGDWDWHDWGKNIDAAVLDSAWYYLALAAAVNMAKVSGHIEDLAEWQSRQAAIVRGFSAKFWNGKEYRSSGYQGDTDDRANALAVVAGLADKEKYAALREVLARHQNAGPYMEKYVLESLYLMNAPDQAMERMKQRWRKQIDSPITTLWEGWGLGAEGYGGGTYNHAWSGGPLTLLSQYAAGIAPEEPGYAKYHVLPQMGLLKSIHAVVSTPMGEIKVEARRERATFKLDLVSPAKSIATIGIPKEPKRLLQRVKANGKLVWSRSASQVSLNDCRYVGEDNEFLRFSVPGGRWRFEALFE